VKNSGIQWTTHTFNPWIGCHKVSPGCKHCYAEAQDKRWKKGRWGLKAPRDLTSPSYWKQPARWNAEAAAAGRRDRVFCASLADVFEDREELVPWRLRLFELIKGTPALDWLLLTKRPENIDRLWPYRDEGPGFIRWPNIWLGTTVEDQEHAELRVRKLASVPAKVRFLSVEPMLGPIDLDRCGIAAQFMHWIICGGESSQGGAKARPFDADWARDLMAQARARRIPFFMKQMGSAPRDSVSLGADQWWMKLEDKHGGELEEWPAEFRVREIP
jgi:protein gp37